MVFTGTSITDFYTLKTQKNTPVTVNYLLKKKIFVYYQDISYKGRAVKISQTINSCLIIINYCITVE